jgi:hypothetical protein
MWMNDAQRAIAALRPDAFPITETIVLKEGTKQEIPPSGLRMGSVVRNITMADAPGPTVRKTYIQVMDLDPDWHSAQAANTIQHWMDDPADPRSYYVYPPAAAGTKVEITYPAIPPTILLSEISTENISLPDEFIDAMVEWILFRAYSELNSSKFVGAAGTHLNQFATMVGATRQQAEAMA